MNTNLGKARVSRVGRVFRRYELYRAADQEKPASVLL